MNYKLNRNAILEEAAKMADERGAQSLTLKSLAEQLGIKPPSLYKHFSGGLDEINTELMLYGWSLMEKSVINSAVGRSGDEAVMAICQSYRSFARNHKGLYEIMQWYNMYQSEKHLKATEGMVNVMMRIMDAYEVETEEKVHTVRMLRSFLHGFAMLESHSVYGSPYPVDDTFDFSVKTIINGISDISKAKPGKERK